MGILCFGCRPQKDKKINGKDEAQKVSQAEPKLPFFFSRDVPRRVSPDPPFNRREAFARKHPASASDSKNGSHRLAVERGPPRPSQCSPCYATSKLWAHVITRASIGKAWGSRGGQDPYLGKKRKNIVFECSFVGCQTSIHDVMQ